MVLHHQVCWSMGLIILVSFVNGSCRVQGIHLMTLITIMPHAICHNSWYVRKYFMNLLHCPRGKLIYWYQTFIWNLMKFKKFVFCIAEFFLALYNQALLLCHRDWSDLWSNIWSQKIKIGTRVVNTKMSNNMVAYSKHCKYCATCLALVA